MKRLAFAVVLVILVSGCTGKRALTHTPPSVIEQLLVAGAAERSASRLQGPDLRGARVYLEATGLTKDAVFARETVAMELQSRGAAVVTEQAKATHIVRILVQALGTDQVETFFGIPKMSSSLLPIPEIALFRRQKQTGRSRLRFTVIDAQTGHAVGEAQAVDGKTAFTHLTILLFGFEWSDVDGL